MICNRIELRKILFFLGEKVLKVYGPVDDVYVDNLADCEHVNETTLDWVKASNPRKQQIVECSKANVLLVDPTILPIEGKTLVVVARPKVILAEIGNHFFEKKILPFIHPTAVVHSEAIIGEDVAIGAYSVIGKAKISDGCIIDSNVRIYDEVEMGRCCMVKSGAVLGGAGFGFEKDGEGNRFRFPQIGRLVIGDNVEVGSNTCIDRGSLSDTVIGSNTKISNLCQIAHNNRIGHNVFITSCVVIAGSNVIDDNVWISPNVSIRGLLHIGEGAKLGLGAVVVKDVPPHEIWVGNPARKIKK